jgi:solute carrier family 39 (zinc transporter), member 1/2/3
LNGEDDLKENLIARNEDAVDEPEKPKGCCDKGTTPFILMVALSIHSFFEGFALGLCREFGTATSIFFAILIHKGIAGSSLGISLVKTFPDDITLCKWLVFSFAISSPIGIALGMSLANASELVEVIFTCLAAGTFVYIGCSEVVVQEFSVPGDRLLKLAAYLVGALIIILLWFADAD